MTSRTYLELDIKATGQAHILLTSDNGSVLEVVIGGWYNTQSAIRSSKQGTEVVTKSGPVLDGTQYIRFNISWGGSDLVVQRESDQVYSHFMTLPQWRNYGSTNTIEKIDFATGWGAIGNWRIYSQYTLLEAYEKRQTVYVMAMILANGNSNSIEKLAVEKNDIEMVEFFKNCTSESFSQTYNGSSLLHIATENENPVEMLDLLISSGTPLDAVDSHGKTALMIAASTRSTEAMEYLLSQHADALTEDSVGFSMLHHVIINYDVEYIRNLLNSYTFELDFLTRVMSVFIYPSPNAIALSEHIILRSKNSTSVLAEDLLLPKLHTKTYENELDELGTTPLHTAFEAEDFFQIQMLLANGLDPTILSDKGLSPFHLAALDPNFNVFELFSMTDIDHNTSNRQTALHLAIEAGNMPVIEKLLQNKADVNAIDNNGNSPIFLAAKLGLESLVTELANAGADLTIRNFYGQSLSSIIGTDFFNEILTFQNQCEDMKCSANEMCEKQNDKLVCECKPGFHKVGDSCSDLDECSRDPCPENTLCGNSYGSFSCLCAPGYVKSYDGSCMNVNECLQSPCSDKNSFCVDTEGSYFCTCKKGLIGDGKFLVGCIDANECIFDPCDQNAVCENSFGSFQCTCNEGYTGDGFSCLDINECTKNPCIDSLSCVNHDGGFSCGCSDSIGTGIKEPIFREIPYLNQPLRYEGIAILNLPSQDSRIYPGCIGQWGEMSISPDCSCDTQTHIRTRECTSVTPCDESYCDLLEGSVCKVKMPCIVPLCIKSLKSRNVNGEFELDRDEISQDEFCDFLNEFKGLYCTGAIKCLVEIGEYSSEYTQC